MLDLYAEIEEPVDIALDRRAQARKIAAAAGGLEPYSVQMHVHSSFSEGHGSLESHTWESDRVGLDVLWWSDHDWRIRSYRHCAIFDFDDWTEPLDQDETWVANTVTENNAVKSLVQSSLGTFDDYAADFDSSQPFEGAAALRLEATSSAPQAQLLGYQLLAQRARFRRTLVGDITVDVAVLPLQGDGVDATGILEFVLSLHPDPAVPRTLAT